MNCPRIEVDLSKIRDNTRTIVRRLGQRGIGVTGVTKSVCGHPAIAQAMLEEGAVGLGDARISNVERLRKAGLTCPITLIRTPMLGQVEQVVRLCETSYNTEVAVIQALSSAAVRINRVHGIILMVEMGDRREGILPRNVIPIAQQVMDMPGVTLKGIGANFACLGGVAPNADDMAALSDLANEVEGMFGPTIQTVSGGNSSNLPWALSRQSIGRINDLRLGEAILLGVDPVSGQRIENMHADAFSLIAEVIETGAGLAPAPIDMAGPGLAAPCLVPDRRKTTRLILALGHQDTDISGLSMPMGSKLIGATSDHLVTETARATPKVGSEMRFQMNYSALMRAMAAPDIEVELLNDRPCWASRTTHNNAEYLRLV